MSDYYTSHAQSLFDIYEGVKPEDLYPVHLPVIREKAGGSALDVGSGSGRDAAWLASLGYAVTAAEPNDEMRSRASALHGDGIVWSSAALPALLGLPVPSGGFDLVFSNGVFMHVRPGERLSALASMRGVLARDGILCVNFRSVIPEDEGRAMYPIHADEIGGHAATLGMSFSSVPTRDVLGRKPMDWWACTLAMPISN